MYCDYFLEYTNFKDDLREYKCLNCNKRYRQKFDEKLKERFFKTCKFSKTISLFYHYEQVCILTDIWMIGKNSMKQRFLKKKIFIVT